MTIIQDEISLLKVKNGVDGGDGVGIKNSTFKYGVSTSGTTKPSNWSTTIPTVPEGQFLWTETTWTYTDNTNEKGYSVAKQGAKGDPTGITVSPTVPTNPYINMLWQNTGSSNGYLTGAIYQWNGAKWNIFIFSAENIAANSLSAISANLGTITAGEIITSFFRGDSISSAIKKRGTTIISDGQFKSSFDYVQITNNTILGKGDVVLDENGFMIRDLTASNETMRSTSYKPEGIFMTDANADFGIVALEYQDLMVVSPTQLQPAMNHSIYSASDTNLPTARRQGRVITLSGAFKPNGSLTSSNDEITMGYLPVWARPSVPFNQVVQGSGMNRFNLMIRPDGSLNWSRYGTNTYATVAAGTWLNISCAFTAKDL